MASSEESPSDEDLSVAESIADAAWEAGGTCAYTAASIWEMFGVDENDLRAESRRRIELALNGEGVWLKPRLSGRRIRPNRIITVRLGDDAMRIREGSRTQQRAEGSVDDAFAEPAEFVEIGVSEPLFARAVTSPGADRAVGLETDWLVTDPHGRLVAVVPGPGRREARTRDKSYLLDVERERFTWKVVMRVAGTNRIAAIASPTFSPRSFKLHFSGSRRQTSMRLSQKWMVGGWRLRSDRKQLLSIAPITADRILEALSGNLPGHPEEMSGYHIALAERGPKEIPLGLPLILALHTILLASTIPGVPGATQ